ncbi:MAG: glycosyltransferase [Spiribacter salinus]|uniref:Glycosyltransferase n=1 Tax=Spiribacter salinus TaxID=1335746 RepID=A0A540VPI9_9GAMM|nr:MAG: glycosyltransferase [Spiribacter salinus]
MVAYAATDISVASIMLKSRPQPRASLHVIFVASRFRDGGVEQRINRLAAGMLQHGVRCTFLLGETGEGAAGEAVPDGVNVEVHGRLERGLHGRLRSLTPTEDGPAIAVIAFRATDYSFVVATVRRQGNHRIGAFLITGAHISERLQGTGLSRIRAAKLRYRMRRQWSRADGVLAISPDIADDWRDTGIFPPNSIHAVHPPVVGEDVTRLAAAKPEHAWASDDGPPIIVGVGRLHPVKRFNVLLDAFHRVRAKRELRLVILGRGPEERALRQQAQALGIAEHVAFPGFTTNPYAWMRRARLLVLPSLHEPFGLVLIESLFTGTPFIALEAAKGPASIKSATGMGRLAPGADDRTLAATIEDELAQSPCRERLHQSARPYDTINSATEHLAIVSGWLGVPRPQPLPASGGAEG